MKRKSTRIYPIGEGQFVHLCKEWSLKYGQYLYYVSTWGERPERTLLKTSSFAEARQFVREVKP